MTFTGLLIAARCQSHSRTGQKLCLHLKILMGPMSASLECMCKNTALTALNPIKG